MTSGLCGRCGERRTDAEIDGQEVCTDCMTSDEISGIQDSLWQSRRGLPSRMRAIFTASKLIDAMSHIDPGAATELIRDMSPLDYRQVMGALAARAAAAEMVVDALEESEGNEGMLRGKMAALFDSQDDDADMFTLFGAIGAQS